MFVCTQSARRSWSSVRILLSASKNEIGKWKCLEKREDLDI